MANQSVAPKNGLFFTGMFFLVLALALVGFSLYMLPHLLFGWVYDVPGFIFSWREALVRNYSIGSGLASVVIFLFFFILGLICLLLSVFCSNQLESEGEKTEAEQVTKPVLRRNLYIMSDTLFRILIAVIIVMIVVELIEHFLFIDKEAVLTIEREL